MGLVFGGGQVHGDQLFYFPQFIYYCVPVHKKAGSCLLKAVMVDQIMKQGVFQICLVLQVIAVKVDDSRMAQQHHTLCIALSPGVLHTQVGDEHWTGVALVDDPGFLIFIFDLVVQIEYLVAEVVQGRKPAHITGSPAHTDITVIFFQQLF